VAGIPQTQRHTYINTNFGQSPSSDRFLALVTANGTDTGAGTAVTGGGYARAAIAFTAAAAGATQNTAQIDFTATANWGTVVGIEVYDAVTGGNRVYWAPLDASRTVNNTDTLRFAAGSITYTWSP
jgi:hypothetical protein